MRKLDTQTAPTVNAGVSNPRVDQFRYQDCYKICIVRGNTTLGFPIYNISEIGQHFETNNK